MTEPTPKPTDALEWFRAKLDGNECHTCTEYGFDTCERCKQDRVAIAAWEEERADNETFIRDLARGADLREDVLAALRAALERIEVKMRDGTDCECPHCCRIVTQWANELRAAREGGK